MFTTCCPGNRVVNGGHATSPQLIAMSAFAQVWLVPFAGVQALPKKSSPSNAMPWLPAGNTNDESSTGVGMPTPREVHAPVATNVHADRLVCWPMRVVGQVHTLSPPGKPENMLSFRSSPVTVTVLLTVISK